MKIIEKARKEISDTLNYFKNLYQIAKKYGIKDAWDFDRMITEMRNPGIKVYDFEKDFQANRTYGLGIVQEKVLMDDGKYRLTQTRSIPLGEALDEGLISQENYDDIVVAHQK